MSAIAVPCWKPAGDFSRIVLLDLHLPGGNSLMACEQIKRMAQHTTVIVLTADADASLRPHVLAAGASAFIDKHAMVDTLLAAIASTQRDGQDV